MMHPTEMVKVGAVAGGLMIAAMSFGPANAQAHDWPDPTWSPREGCGQMIKLGDTLFEMAERNGITLDDIEASNPWIDDLDKVGANSTIDVCPAAARTVGGSPSLQDLIDRGRSFEPVDVVRPPAVPGLDAGKATLQTYAAQQAAAYGWTGSEIDALNELVHRESSWNPRADNPTSTAFGLFQFLRQTAIDYEMNHPDRNGATPTVEAQVAAGLQYIEDRYGSPSEALRFHRSHNWY